jgi:hypothetical protein
VVLLHALISVIHAVLQAAAAALLAGFSLLLVLLIVLAVLVGGVLTFTGALGAGGLRWVTRRRRNRDKPEDPEP